MTYQPSPQTPANASGGLRFPRLWRSGQPSDAQTAPSAPGPAADTLTAPPRSETALPSFADSNFTGPNFSDPNFTDEVGRPPDRQVNLPANQRGQRLGLTVTLRLLLLGVGLPLAWLIGIGTAQVVGHRSDQVPFQEVTLRRASRIVAEVRYLPSRWWQPDRSVTRVEPVPIPTEPIAPLSQAAKSLSATERQVALEEASAIATELRSLNRRLVDLETRLGRAQSTADLKSRLAAIRASLQTTEIPADTPPAPISPVAEVAHPLLETTELQVTLPSDALFVPGEARLLETAPIILSTILSDLNRYPNATILIGSHTDDRSDSPIGRELSFRQASALQAYLTASLGEAGPQDASPASAHRWVTVGYGQSQPLANNDTPEARQRNRRIEIAVDRR